MKWANRKRMAKGNYKGVPPYGYCRKGIDFHLVPDEAKVVEQIFQWTLMGFQCIKLHRK